MLTSSLIIMLTIILTAPAASTGDSNLMEASLYSMGAKVPESSFEIELGWIDDIASLYNELDIAVLGNVHETPRYGMGGEAWVDGEWVNQNFDTTLSDRFVVNCTVDKALNMSGYAWVEWTAPLLEGTAYEGELPPPDEEFGMLFEYGAESGILQPPWDYVEGPHDTAAITFSSWPVRSGTKSVRFYVGDPTVGESQHCKVLEWTNYGVSEAYYSTWMYVPVGRVVNDWVNVFQWKDSNPSGPPGNEFRPIMGFHMLDTPSNPAGYLRFLVAGWAQSGGQSIDSGNIGYVQTGQWIHLQVWIRTSSVFRGNDGAVMVWIDDVLKVDWANIGTRGEGGESHYMWGVGNYVSENEPHDTWLYFDDTVMATGIIPYGYRVWSD